MSDHITLRRGLDLKLKGATDSGAAPVAVKADKVALVPDDFPGFTPKVVAKPGEKVVAGQPLLVDKNNPAIAIVSPVDGTVGEVVRGERRKILRVTVDADPVQSSTAAAKAAPKDEQSIRQAMMEGGVWAMMRQLPYDIVPAADVKPRDIFVTAFDSAPLASPLIDRVASQTEAINAAIDALGRLTDGHIYIGVRNSADLAAVKGDRLVITEFEGPHPAGLASVQAAAIAPVNKGEAVWLLDIETLARIGQVLTAGRADWSTIVALTGSEVETPSLLKTTVGAEVAPLLKGRVADADHHQRIISGNVLTGVTVAVDGFLRYPYRQITVIPEGDDVDEFMGWASMSPKKMSESRTFLSKLFGKKSFAPDARLNGGRRAMIMSGEYEKVMPMDIMPEHLVKAILARDIDRMEALGIYEVTPADFALCEYIDPSKLELQKIVRQGLDYLRKELS
ncbi:MAG: Na(+)-translocating NADH-quinone reductase subunit A [Bacteroides sp.]|nr:Na(+)-translocating NADH-quinone reductase subunit A [Bacteroides sp.]